MLTRAQFTEKIARISEREADDLELMREDAEDIILDLLTDIGYGEGVGIYEGIRDSWKKHGKE